MITGEKAKTLNELVETFTKNIDVYKSSQYDEANVRVDFIDKFFELFDWDVRNVSGYSESYRDVVREDRVEIEGKPKAPDYSFRIGGVRKFFVEAKKPKVYIKEEIAPAFQLRRYAYTAKLPLSILTDFEEFAVYDTRIKPSHTDAASTARIFYCNFKDYESNFDSIYDVFSKTAILKGSFDRYVSDPKMKKGTSEVDKELLKLIDEWRTRLAASIAHSNPDLDVYQMNEAVQKIIDRIVFLRIAEDRKMEKYGRLRDNAASGGVYARLNDLFLRANDKYNSGLFDPEPWIASLSIDDKVLASIAGALYYPECPYEFSVMPVEILGDIYEQFLGKTIRLKGARGGHTAVVEDKPEVRKAGGVFYTPHFIVDYIVEHTLGAKLADAKTPDAVSKLRVLDPACGSGSFLVEAYARLLKYHHDHYTAEGNLQPALKKGVLYQSSETVFKLSIPEKQRILLNGIYGVDIDPQAVEVTKLSLLLKLMEDEELESEGELFKHSDLKILPDLSANVRCGNSLVGSDFYDEQDMSLFDRDAVRKVNVFDWKKGFPEVFAAGGFDVVIGNPPYVRQEGLTEKGYFASRYAVYHGMADLYAYFIEKGYKLLKKGGVFGIIVSNKWMRANYGAPLRSWLETSGIEELIDFGDLPVFTGATVYPCILRLKSSPPDAEFPVSVMDSLDFTDMNAAVAAKRFTMKRKYLGADGWTLADERSAKLMEKLRGAGTTLEKYTGGKIYYGIKTGLNEAFVIDAATRDRLIAEDPKSAEVVKPFLLGRDIKRYEPLKADRYLILFPKGWTNEHNTNPKHAWQYLSSRYPAVANHLKPFEAAAKKRFDQGDYWWELRACDYWEEFEKPKIICPAIVQHPSYSIDNNGIYSNDKTTIIAVNDYYLLGLCNSKLSDYYIRSIASTKQGGYYEYKPMYISSHPIVPPEKNKPLSEKIASLAEQALAVRREAAGAKTDSEKRAYATKAEAIDGQIDRAVYELYGLTGEEIAVVEGNEVNGVKA